MKKIFGIITAMDEESKDFFRGQSQDLPSIGRVKLRKVELEHYTLIIAVSGWGKVAASIATTLLIREFKCEEILNFGMAGSVDPRLRIGDFIVPLKCYFYDFCVTSVVKCEKGYNPSLDFHYFSADTRLFQKISLQLKNFTNSYLYHGHIGTGDRFLSDKEIKRKMKLVNADLFAVDMESAAVGQVCAQFSTPFISVRVISDLADSHASVDFNEFTVKCSKKMGEFLKSFFRNE